MAKHFKFLVGGEWRSSDERAYVANPFNGSAVGVVSLAHEEDVEDAIGGAVAGYREMRELSAFERSQILSRIARSIEKRRAEFAELITNESGKPIRFSSAEVERAISTFDLAAEEATRLDGEVVGLDVTSAVKNRKGIVTRFPIGPIACVSPFNFPLNLIAHKVAPAIAAGNSFIVKPPPQTPLTSLLLGDCLLDSGLPRGTMNVLPCANEIAEMLVTDQRIAMLSFTGSARVGWDLKARAGKKKVVLELGGNAAVIVDRHADVDLAVERCVLGAFSYAGQVCIKVQRIYVHKSLYKNFELKFLEAVSEVKVGNPLENSTVVGPMISLAEAERVESWVKEAVAEGATITWGGKRRGSMVEPTVLDSVTPSMKVCREEVFGPVATLHKTDSLEHAVAEVNDSKYGLQAGIFTSEWESMIYAYRHLDVGGVIVNDYPTFRVDNMIYGGVKDSGSGREGVRYAMKEMTEPKLLVLKM